MARCYKCNCNFAKLLLVLSGFYLLACHDNHYTGRADISAYYFPIEALRQGMIYEYRPMNDSGLDPEYWHYRFFDSLESVWFEAGLFRPDGSIAQEVLNERVENGFLQRSLTLYDRDSLGLSLAIEAGIEQDNVFPFYPVDSSKVYLYRAEYYQPVDSILITLVRNRRFIDLGTDSIFGKKYSTARFFVKELLKTTLAGSTETVWDGEELYARNTGLVYYRKEISQSFTLEYGLYGIYPFESLKVKMGW